MTKNYRQGQILKLIRTKRITTQEELSRELRADGIEATQVTLSRDIRELGLAKTADGYREILADSAGAELGTVLSEFLLDVRLAQNIIVLKTSAGNALNQRKPTAAPISAAPMNAASSRFVIRWPSGPTSRM